MPVFISVDPIPSSRLRRVNLGDVDRAIQPTVVRAAGRASVRAIRALTPRAYTRLEPVETLDPYKLFTRLPPQKRPGWRRRLWKTVRGYSTYARHGRMHYIAGYLPPGLYLPQARSIEQRYGPIRTTAQTLRPIFRQLAGLQTRSNMVNFLNNELNQLGLTRKYSRRRDDVTRDEQDYYQTIVNFLQRRVFDNQRKFIGTMPSRADRLRPTSRRRPDRPLMPFPVNTRQI